jgi:hypothetical protein
MTTTAPAMTGEDLRELLDTATPTELRQIVSVAWVLDRGLLARAAGIAAEAGRCTCGGCVTRDGVFHAAVAS